MAEEFDAVIIGGGISGLVCGALLAKEGRKVLLMEKNQSAGGCCTSFNRSGYTFDAAFHFFQGFGKDQPLESMLGEVGALEDMSLITSPTLYTLIFPDHTIDVPRDLSQYISLLGTLFPREKKRLRRMFDVVEKIALEAERFPLYPGFRQRLISPVTAMWTSEYRGASFYSFLGDFIRDKKLKAILGALWPCLGLPPSKVSAIRMCLLLHQAHAHGFFYPEGGSRRLAEGLARAFERMGGTLRLNSRASRIFIMKRAVKGVQTAGGETLLTSCVVSCADVSRTFLALVGEDNVSLSFANRLRALRPSCSFFQAWLGSSLDPASSGITAPHVFMYSSYDGDTVYSECLEGKPSCIMASFPSLLDPSLAPPLSQVIRLAVPASFDYTDNWRSGDFNEHGPEYRELKQKTAENLIEKAEKILPGLGGSIKVLETATPLTLDRYTQNRDGAAYGWENSPRHYSGGTFSDETFIRGLFLAGHWTSSGGGSLAAALSARAASESVLNRAIAADAGREA